MWLTPDSWSYLPVLLLIAVALIIAAALLGVNLLLGKRVDKRHQPATKFTVYECGVPPVGNARQQFSVRYYLVGLIFLLFDMEVIFMFPWALTYREFISQGPYVLVLMGIFLGILATGHVYLLRRKALSWD